MQQVEALNHAFFLAINAHPDANPLTIDAAIVIAVALIYLIPLLLVGLWLWGDERKRNTALRAFLVVSIGIGLNQILALVWPHPRPFMIGLGQTWLAHAADSSFPSDHATVFAGVGVTLLFAGEIGLAYATGAVGLCVAWARIYLGVHFPLDMLGALGVAAVAYAITLPLWHALGETATRFLQRLYRQVMAWPIDRGWIRR